MIVLASTVASLGCTPKGFITATFLPCAVFALHPSNTHRTQISTWTRAPTVMHPHFLASINASRRVGNRNHLPPVHVLSSHCSIFPCFLETLADCRAFGFITEDTSGATVFLAECFINRQWLSH